MQKTIIITGCSKGVGRATAELLSKDYEVIALSRSENTFNSLNIKPYQIDISNKDEREILFEYCKNKNIVGLINNATASLGRELLLEDNILRLNKTLDINIISSLELSKLFFKKLIENNGNIINITSIAAYHPNKNNGHYIIAKAGASMMTKILRLETVGMGLGVTELIPGMINSEEKNDYGLEPEDLAESIRWVLSLPKHVNIDKIQLMNRRNAI